MLFKLNLNTNNQVTTKKKNVCNLKRILGLTQHLQEEASTGKVTAILNKALQDIAEALCLRRTTGVSVSVQTAPAANPGAPGLQRANSQNCENRSCRGPKQRVKRDIITGQRNQYFQLYYLHLSFLSFAKPGNKHPNRSVKARLNLKH